MVVLGAGRFLMSEVPMDMMLAGRTLSQCTSQGRIRTAVGIQPCVSGYIPVWDDRGDFTRGCIPRAAGLGVGVEVLRVGVWESRFRIRLSGFGW